ncbi:MAG: single-stranded DNA-binding protein, partial [Bacteroidaceae bacterium]|nr:single-stranded DNA-binding protein [Bacteroidaceae bacterium]
MNVIKLSGVVNDAPKFSHECKGENFYTFDIATERRSGYVDVIPCVVPELLVGMIEQYGKYMVLGEVRTRNVKAVDSSRIRCEVSVFVKNVDEYCGEDVNEVHAVGYICRKPSYRTTPLGRNVSDLTIACPRETVNRTDYIPTIAWGRSAERASVMSVGDKVSLSGRMQ